MTTTPTFTIPEAATGVQYREMQIREINKEARTITGIVVPYGEVIEIAGYREMFEKGSVGGAVGKPLYFGHDHRQGGTPIGLITEERDLDEGHEITAHISETRKGEEIYTLLKDDVIKTFSAGFNPVENRVEDDVLVRTATDFLEASVTPFAAYKTAKVAEVRSADDNKEKESPVDTNDTQVADLRDALTDLERKYATLAESGVQSNAGFKSQYRSAGEALKALAAGETEKVVEETRAFADYADTGQGARPAWLERPFKIVQEKRRLINLLSKAPLPAEGMTLTYPATAVVAGTVGKQANEGAALSYMEVSLANGSATVGTYGGYTSVSRQVIDRSPVNYLQAMFNIMAEQYAKATNADVGATFAAENGQGVALAGSLATRKAADFLGWAFDANAAIETNSLGLGADFFIASADVMRRLVTLVDTNDRPVFAINGDGSNTVGNANLKAMSASIAGIPVVYVPALAVRTLAAVSADAVTWLESPGAPFKLEDESVINLTKDFSLYGYGAVTVNDGNGIARATGLLV